MSTLALEECVIESGRAPAWRRAGSALARLPLLAAVGAVRLYQRTLSPVLPIVTLGGCACRFSPTCSHYAVEALQTHGLLAGAWLALRRLIRCTPLSPGGIDPVPASVRRARACRAVESLPEPVTPRFHG